LAVLTPTLHSFYTVRRLAGPSWRCHWDRRRLDRHRRQPRNIWPGQMTRWVKSPRLPEYSRTG